MELLQWRILGKGAFQYKPDISPVTELSLWRKMRSCNDLNFMIRIPIPGYTAFIFEMGHRCLKGWAALNFMAIYCLLDSFTFTPKSVLKFKSPGPWFNIKMSSYQYRKSHCGDKTILRPSYLHNGITYTGKTSLYWIRPLKSLKHVQFCIQPCACWWPRIQLGARASAVSVMTKFGSCMYQYLKGWDLICRKKINSLRQSDAYMHW